MRTIGAVAALDFPDISLVCNGEFGFIDKERINRLRYEEIPLIAVDGGLRHMKREHVLEIVGDLDSLVQIKSDDGGIVELLDQDQSDLCKAIERASTTFGANSIDILAVSRGNLAHQIGVQMSLAATAKMIDLIAFVDDHLIANIPSSRKLEVEKGSRFSLFSYGEVKGICISGAEFGQRGFDMGPGTLGLNNVATSNEIMIERKEGNAALIVVIEQSVLKKIRHS